jgi:hypothetical protein
MGKCLCTTIEFSYNQLLSSPSQLYVKGTYDCSKGGLLTASASLKDFMKD